MSSHHDVLFRPSGRGKARCAPDPDYPHGKATDCSTPGHPACEVALPYPAPECGTWIVRCRECPMSGAITAAGRPDDPTSVRMDCRERYAVQDLAGRGKTLSVTH
jgi:hypothetical protein